MFRLGRNNRRAICVDIRTPRCTSAVSSRPDKARYATARRQHQHPSFPRSTGSTNVVRDHAGIRECPYPYPDHATRLVPLLHNRTDCITRSGQGVGIGALADTLYLPWRASSSRGWATCTSHSICLLSCLSCIALLSRCPGAVIPNSDGVVWVSLAWSSLTKHWLFSSF